MSNLGSFDGFIVKGSVQPVIGDEDGEILVKGKGSYLENGIEIGTDYKLGHISD